MKATIFVDNLKDCIRNSRWRHTKSCHLYTLAGWEDALHEFAAKIGLRRGWYQNGTMPHYDLTEGKRLQAVKAGAIEVSDIEVVEHIRLWRATNKRAKQIVIAEQSEEERRSAIAKAEGKEAR